jgi:hypothetical protein
MDEWLMCQRAWMYLEPIFSSEDIIRQLPVESKRYQTMERIWRKIMKHAKENPEVSCFTICVNYLPTLLKYTISVHIKAKANCTKEIKAKQKCFI